MNPRVAAYLAHAENRIRICKANLILFEAKGDHQQANLARIGIYEWIDKAQDNKEAHF